MGVETKVSQLYENAIADITGSGAKWKSICRLTGQLYRYEFSNIIMVYMQRPRATLIADFDTWKKVGRYVRRGSRGIAIFPSRALKPEMRHVFDISDTGGKNVKLTWELDRENVAKYADFLRQREGLTKEENEKDKSFIKAFTEKQIGVIMDSEFGDRITELASLTGTKRIKVDDETQEITAEEVLKRSVEYAVFTRCGFDIPSEKQDFSFITAFQSEEEIYRLGSLVSDISCEVLRSIAADLKHMEERSIAYARDSIDVSRGKGRDDVSRSDVAGDRGFHDESGQVRKQGNGIPEGEPQGPLPDASPVRAVGTEDAGSGGRGEPDDGGSGDRLSEEQSPEEPTIHDGDVEPERAGEDAGGGDRDGGSSDEVSLEDSEERHRRLEEEINRELAEINSVGSEKEGSWQQASFSFAQNGDVEIPEKYTYTKPKTEPVVPHDYVRQVLLRGNGFSHGKRRIYEIFDTISDPGERAKRIKKEYRQGGAGWPIEGYGLHGFDTYHGNGLRFQWRDEEGEKEGYLKWNAVERELSALIMTGEYYQAPKKYDSDKVSAALWQEPLDTFFNKGFWLDLPNVALNEVLQRELPLSDKVQFVERVFAPDTMAPSSSSSFKNEYGECEVERHNDGISVEFYDETETKWRVKLDWQDCTAYLESMIEDEVYDPRGSYEHFVEMAEDRKVVTGVIPLMEDTEQFLSEAPEEHQTHRVELLERILKAVGREDVEVAWDDTYDVVIARDGNRLWHGRQVYEYIRDECLELDNFKRDDRIQWQDMAQFRHDAASSLDLYKEKSIHRKTFVAATIAREEMENREKELWQETLNEYFNEEIQYISVKTLLYDIFTTNLPLESKAEFLAKVYGEEREEFAMSDTTSGPYGDTIITRDSEGITVSYVKADGTRGEKRVDYEYCAALILHMIEENDYLSEGEFERFQESPQSFTAMPWFMEIYHDYKQKMEAEPNFTAIELPEAEMPVQEQGEIKTEETESNLPDQAEPATRQGKKGTFPEALKQVEEMDNDLREALEIYFQSCSMIRPYQPLLQMMHQSGLEKEVKLSLLHRTINRNGKESKAYQNNPYGIVEYTQDKSYFMVNYKNHEGEWKRTFVTYEQLYSVMEYLIQADVFTERKRQAEYTKEFAEKPYEQKTPLEKHFSDALDNLKAKQDKGNFRLSAGELPKGGPKTRYQWNIEAIRLLKQIEYEGRAATEEEQKILSRYVGWGGIPQAFDANNESWKKEYEELKGLLSTLEYEEARDSVNTAFYTDPLITEAVYVAWKSSAFRAGAFWSLQWVSDISSAHCLRVWRAVNFTAWRRTIFQAGLQSCSIQRRKLRYGAMRKSSTRITFSMLLWAMSHSGITSFLILSMQSTTSVSTIISLQKHWIRSDRAALWRLSQAKVHWTRLILRSVNTLRNVRS